MGEKFRVQNNPYANLDDLINPILILENHTLNTKTKLSPGIVNYCTLYPGKQIKNLQEVLLKMSNW